MIKINKRQVELVNLLISKSEFVALSFFADALKVSSKTISRDVQSIENLIQAHGGEVLRKTGLGIKLEMSDRNKINLRKYVQDNFVRVSKTDTFSHFRKNELELFLMLNSSKGVSIFDVMDEFHICKTLAYDDLSTIINTLQNDNNIAIDLDEAVIHVSGLESDIRIHLTGLIEKFVPVSLFYSPDRHNIKDKVESQQVRQIIEFILNFGNDDSLVKLINQIYSVYELKSNSLEKHWVRLFILISIYRTSQNQKVIFNTELIEKNDMLNHYFNNVALTDPNEISYILSIIENQFEKHSGSIDGLILESYTDDFLDIMSILSSKDLKQKMQYRVSFKHHVQAFYEKKTFENYFSNPILSEVRRKYEDSFKLYELLNWILASKHEIRLLNEDELTSLLIYVESEILKLQRTYNVLLVFDYPNSLLNMLRNKLEIDLPMLKLDYLSDLSLINFERIHEYDFILSTLPYDIQQTIERQIETDILSISPLLNDLDIELITGYIQSQSESSNNSLEMKRIINDFNDIGTSVTKTRQPKLLNRIKVHQDYNFISNHSFNYLISKNDTLNAIEFVFDHNQVSQIIISMKNWDYLLYSLKLIDIFEKSPSNEINEVVNRNVGIKGADSYV